MDELTLTPLELIDRIAALVPPPRTHRHRYFGVLAPNSPLRATAVAMAAAPTQPTMAQTPPTDMGLGASGMVPPGNAQPTQPDPVPLKRPAHYLWAVLIARIYEVFPLVCLIAGLQLAGSFPGEMYQQACRPASQGGMRPAPWKAKFDGHLI